MRPRESRKATKRRKMGIGDSGGQVGGCQKRGLSDFHFLAQFARVLGRDLGAVEQAITSRWSNGPVEGHINRLKMIKRQMYGRAGFELLKARVLPWESADSPEDRCTESA